MLPIFSGKTNEEIKNEVLTELYLTGRYKQMYFGRKSKLKVNPLKAYINRFLAINGVLEDDNEFCEECYQHAFMHLWNKSAEKIVQILEDSPNGTKLVATAVFIIKVVCFAVKKNPKQSGLIFNIINGSSYGGIKISTSEIRNDDSPDSIIIYDEDPDAEPFIKEYNVTVEDMVSRLDPEDQQSFYDLIDKKQPQGKPKKAVQEKKQILFDKLRKIKEDIDDEQRRN